MSAKIAANLEDCKQQMKRKKMLLADVPLNVDDRAIVLRQIEDLRNNKVALRAKLVYLHTRNNSVQNKDMVFDVRQIIDRKSDQYICCQCLIALMFCVIILPLTLLVVYEFTGVQSRSVYAALKSTNQTIALESQRIIDHYGHLNTTATASIVEGPKSSVDFTVTLTIMGSCFLVGVLTRTLCG